MYHTISQVSEPARVSLTSEKLPGGSARWDGEGAGDVPRLEDK